MSGRVRRILSWAALAAVLGAFVIELLAEARPRSTAGSIVVASCAARASEQHAPGFIDAVALPDGRSVSVAGGATDVPRDGVVQVLGWTYLPGPTRLADVVVAHVGDRCYRAVVRERPDVAKATNDPRLLRSGYDVTLPVGDRPLAVTIEAVDAGRGTAEQVGPVVHLVPH